MKITLGLFALLVLLVAPEEGDLILKAPYQDSRGESVFI